LNIGKSVLSCIITVALAFASGGCSLLSAGGPQDEPSAAETGTDYPNKDIEMIVGYTAGGGTDVVARIVVDAANKYMPNGKSIVITNKPGSSGTNALAEIMPSTDGYTIASVTAGSLAIQPNYGKTPFKSDSFIPIAQFNSAQNLLVVRSDAPWKTYDEWLAWVKKNPGQFIYGSSGEGNTQHLAMEAINILEGIQTRHAPFDGAAQSINALLGGHIQGVVLLSQEAKLHVDSGAMRVLANAGTSKIEEYNNTAFLRNKGFIGLDTWSGVAVSASTPKHVVTILREVFRQAMKDPSVKTEFNKIGIEPAYEDSAQFAKIISQTNNLTRDVAKVIGLVK
jgi:tripartite-type tricarboxylate transporter receptor subunit TctC